MGRMRTPLAIVTLSALLIGLFFYFTQPKPIFFPFSLPIQRRADYRPPIDGVTLYPTEGPFGVGVIQTIAAGSGDTLFVGTYGEGLFRSDDGGNRWAPANLGLRDKFIINLTRTKEGLLFAATIRAGLFMSRDEGRHWVSVNRGLENTDVQSMASLSGGRLFAGTGQGVFVSRDEGDHWTSFNEGLESVMVRSLVVGKNETLYAGTQGKGIYIRRSGGDRWTELIGGFNFEGMEEKVIRALVLERDETLFAGTLGAGLFRSRDGGAHWEKVNGGLSSLSIRSLAADGSGTLYAAAGEDIYYSRDNGDHWTPFSEGLIDARVDAFVASEKGDLFVGTGAGLFRGRPQVPWTPLHEGLRTAPIRTIALTCGVPPCPGEGDLSGEEVTVGTDGKGVFFSKEENWISDNVGLVNLSVRVMARGKMFLYIVTEEGLYRRQIGRHRWDAVEGTPPARILSMGVDVTEQLYAGTPSGLFVSSDHGLGWRKVDEVESAPIIAVSARGHEVLAATPNALWVKSETGRQHSEETEHEWKRLVSKEGAPFRFVAWGEEKSFFVGSDQSVWRGDLDGAWRDLTGTLPVGTKITSLAVDPRNREVLYIGSDRGLYWSGDGGENWRLARLYQGERFEKQVNAILPAPSGVLWIATEENGVILGIDQIPKRSRLQRWFQEIVHR